MPHRIMDYLRKNSNHNRNHLKENLVKLGYDEDEIEEAIEEFESQRHNEENIPLFIDPYE
jgi:Holliday junction resolvasome RuvABC DNA-binding subunit